MTGHQKEQAKIKKNRERAEGGRRFQFSREHSEGCKRRKRSVSAIAAYIELAKEFRVYLQKEYIAGRWENFKLGWYPVLEAAVLRWVRELDKTGAFKKYPKLLAALKKVEAVEEDLGDYYGETNGS